MAKKLNGIIKYNIIDEGCLIGIFTNTHIEQIYPEMAKKIINSEGLAGKYNCEYLAPDKMHDCKLHIKGDKKNEKIFRFKWFDGSSVKPFNEGIGMKIDDKTIIVSYWEV